MLFADAYSKRMNRRSCVQDALFFSARAWPWQAAAPVLACYTDVNILHIRMLQNGCCGYTDVNISRIRTLQTWMLWLHGC